MEHSDFDVVVVGGGHAGVEAAQASARMGVRTALITMRPDDLGVMSCNPAIGGLGKGHLVREIDALDGLMGRAADYAGIQFRLLNRRKGPAVQGPRAQTDRVRYQHATRNLLSNSQNLTVLTGEVVDLTLNHRVLSGVVLGDGSIVSCRAVVIATGTFLRGKIHIGSETHAAGRMKSPNASKLAVRFDDLGLPLGRLKTGTPPRLDGKTIDWTCLEQQPGDDDPTLFSFLSNAPVARQVCCGITHTNEQTHDIIRTNLNCSALYGGAIEGVGPRYCPSIEDKVVRFPEKTSHQIFLEPEGLDTDLVYPNGISTSLPKTLQEQYVRSIRGLENTQIVQPGYAIEYDYVDPRALTAGLSLIEMPGMFLAGQINGTTGYEEAAAQGLVAGLNAARLSRNLDPVYFSRTESYIGVMIDDLTTRGVTEPYRMFTSRAEFRLTLRADNADQRLTGLGRDLGIVGDHRIEIYEKKRERLEKARNLMGSVRHGPSELAKVGISPSKDGQKRTALELLSFKEVTFADLVVLDERLGDTDPEIQKQLENEAVYANYTARQENDAKALKNDESVLIPADLNYRTISGVSNELSEKLERIRPSSIGQAGRIEGMTPAAIVAILCAVRIPKRAKTG